MTPEELTDGLAAVLADQKAREEALTRQNTELVAGLKSAVEGAEALAKEVETLTARAAVLTAQKADLQTALDAAGGTAEALAEARVAVTTLTAERAALAAQVAALTARVAELTPPAGAVVPADVFRARLAPAYLALSAVDPAVSDKWKRIISDFLPTTMVTVDLNNPLVAQLVHAARADGLLTPDQAAAALARPPGA